VNEVIEAPTIANHGAKVFRWHLRNMWQGLTDVREYYIQGATWANYDNAVQFSKQQAGKPYSLKKFLYDKSAYYCSKLIFLAYLEVGFNLLNSVFQAAITPSDLALHYHTRLYRNIGGGRIDY